MKSRVHNCSTPNSPHSTLILCFFQIWCSRYGKNNSHLCKQHYQWRSTVTEKRKAYSCIRHSVGYYKHIQYYLYAYLCRKTYSQQWTESVLCIDGYFNSLINMLETVYEKKFASQANRDVYEICNSFEDLKAKLDKFQKQN